MPNILTLNQHILEMQGKHKEATGDFSGLLSEIAIITKMISREVNRAGLTEILGTTGNISHQGDEVQRLDEFANETFINILGRSGHLAIMASEEMADPIPIPEGYDKGKYVITFDPLDGSSNIDANVSVGSIFSIHEKISPGDEGTEEDLLQPGSKQVAAGYVIYGSSTMFVYTTGQGVHGFTLDPGVGEFLLSHPDIKIPDRMKIYCINECSYDIWDEKLKKYHDDFRKANTESGLKTTSRYIGSLVADFHRNLLYGGIFMYPGNKQHPKGKLRLLYEANPMAMLAQQAGGYASDGTQSIMDIKPEDLHQKTPLFVGNKEEIKKIEGILK